MMENETSNRLRVVFIARNYPPGIGGAEKLNYDLARRLNGHAEVTVIQNHFGKHNPFFYPYAFVKYLMLRLRKKTDVVFLSDAMLSPLIPLFRILKQPVALKAHGLDVTYPNRIYQVLMKRFAAMADSIICISEATRDECIKRGMDAGKCEVIPIGIDPHEFYLDEEKDELRKRACSAIGVEFESKQVLFSVGRLVERKGFHWFVENVMPDLIKSRDDLLYLIAGDGIMKERIEESVREQGLEDCVLLLGEVDAETLKLLYNASDVFIMPNIEVEGDIEGFGIVALEASSCKLPVIAPMIEGIQSAMRDRCDSPLVEPRSTSDFVQGINELLDDYGKREYFGKVARETALDRFCWDSVVQKYLCEFSGIA